MDIQSNKYTFIFATIVCLVSSILLSAITEGLREKQQINGELEIKKNILKAVKLKIPVSPVMSAKEILEIFKNNIEEEVIDGEGNIVASRAPKDIKENEKSAYPLYIYKEGEDVISYAFPISGQGLWSTLYGYIAIEADAVTVRGVTFYKHGETPGLGAEIEKDWFQNNFSGKKIYSIKEQQLKPIAVVKGKVKDLYKGERAEHYVDGITAATLTGNGVTELLSRWLTTYEPYFKKIRKI